MERKHRVEVIDRTMAAVFAAKTPAERVEMASQSHRAARLMIAAHVARLHPEWSEEQRQREVLRRMLGRGADGYLAACR